MEGVERALFAFNYWGISRFFYSLGCISEKRKSKLFRKKWLQVSRGVEPELLIWENFGVSTSSRLVRVVIYVMFILFMLVVCFYLVYNLEQVSNIAEA